MHASSAAHAPSCAAAWFTVGVTKRESRILSKWMHGNIEAERGYSGIAST